MDRMQIDGTPAANSGLLNIPFTDTQTPCIPSGALGKHLHALALFDGEDVRAKHAEYVSLQEADNALRRLMSQPADSNRPTVRDVLEMDPMMLSIMMTQLVLKTTGSNADYLCQQLERATEVQAELRNKQVAEYQEQINKAIEQADQVRKAGIMSAVFDWIISGIETVVGVLKMVEGVLTADPLAVADGAAYLCAGVAGMVKAGAETALCLGADKSTCNDIINTAGTVQTACEGVAMALDIMQIARGLSAARAVTAATEKVLSSGVGEELVDVIAKGAEDELEVLAEKAGQEVSRVMGRDFGMALEREMVDVCDMAAEAAARELEAESNMVRSIGKSFTREGVSELVKAAVKSAGKDLLKEGEEVVAKKLRDTILQKLRRSIVKTVLKDCIHKTLLVARATTGGVNRISASVVSLLVADLERKIERLIAQQGYIDFVQNWTEDRKKTQQKRLSEVYQCGVDAMRIASEISTVLANIAGQRA